jgi:hypothetical protein
MKIIVNHFIDDRIKLVPNSGSDQAWTWVAWDFAPPAETELIETVIRFI